MKKKTFTDEQIVGILHGFEGSGKTIKEYCREKDVSEGTFYKWRSRFGTMEASEVKQYRQLQQENTPYLNMATSILNRTIVKVLVSGRVTPTHTRPSESSLINCTSSVSVVLLG